MTVVAINDETLEAWSLFVAAPRVITSKVEVVLKARVGLSLSEYHTLSILAAASEHRLRMGELAEANLITRSGLTRLVDHLEREELVRREKASDNERSRFAVLTTKGLVQFKKAQKVYLTAVRRHFFTVLTRRELSFLTDAFRRLCPDTVLTTFHEAT